VSPLSNSLINLGLDPIYDRPIFLEFANPIFDIPIEEKNNSPIAVFK
jgi:hypothetical protein